MWFCKWRFIDPLKHTLEQLKRNGAWYSISKLYNYQTFQKISFISKVEHIWYIKSINNYIIFTDNLVNCHFLSSSERLQLLMYFDHWIKHNNLRTFIVGAKHSRIEDVKGAALDNLFIKVRSDSCTDIIYIIFGHDSSVFSL